MLDAMRRVFIVIAIAGCSSSSPGPDAGGCTESADTCTGSLICVINTCEQALPRQYVITQLTVRPPATNNGAQWDPDGSAPDPYVQIIVDGQTIDTTPIEQDTFSASWPGPFQLPLAAGDTLQLHAFDSDLTVDDSIANCASPVDVAMLRDRGFACGAANTIAFQINPL